MTEKSQFWYTDGFTGATGDGAAPYTQEEFRAYNDNLYGEGVVAGAGNELAVSGTATPLAVATGRAQVHGFHYWSTAAEDLTVTTPTVGTTGGRVVLRADWAAAEVRLAVLLNTDGVAAIPALTQTSGTTWEISLASFTVTTGGVITLTDTRGYTSGKKVVLVPASAGRNETDAVSLVAFNAGGYNLENNKESAAFGWFACPEDLVAITSCEAVIVSSSGFANNVYVKNSAFYATAGESLLTTHTDAVGYAAVPVTVAGIMSYVQKLTLPLLAANDMAAMEFRRDGANVADTFASDITIIGWRLEYVTK